MLVVVCVLAVVYVLVVVYVLAVVYVLVVVCVLAVGVLLFVMNMQSARVFSSHSRLQSVFCLGGLCVVLFARDKR